MPNVSFQSLIGSVATDNSWYSTLAYAKHTSFSIGKVATVTVTHTETLYYYENNICFPELS